jgi:hypothetical protein
LLVIRLAEDEDLLLKAAAAVVAPPLLLLLLLLLPAVSCCCDTANTWKRTLRSPKLSAASFTPSSLWSSVCRSGGTNIVKAIRDGGAAAMHAQHRRKHAVRQPHTVTRSGASDLALRPIMKFSSSSSRNPPE